jgi:hypothetical protein
MKLALKILVVPGIAAALLLAAGVVKFNLFDDDIFLAGAEVTAGHLVGAWVRPVDGQPGQEEGFELRQNGEAASVNMATLRYSRWSLPGPGRLRLRSTSVGNKVTSSGYEDYSIISLGQNKLFLRDSYGGEFILSKKR